MYEFKLPDIGEGLSEAELLEWIVRVGDRVREGDDVAMISTDKVNVDLTSPATGVVSELFGEPGDVIIREGDAPQARRGTPGREATGSRSHR